jgi:transcriptional regulator with XRE-family HTH domain
MNRDALDRLGRRIVSRRVALGYRTRTELADSLALTVRTLADIENGVRRASPGTYGMLENKLGWAPGSIETVLADGEPTEQFAMLVRDTPAPESHPAVDALWRTPTETLLMELRRRIIAPRHRRRDRWDPWEEGLDSYGYAPEGS